MGPKKEAKRGKSAPPRPGPSWGRQPFLKWVVKGEGGTYRESRHKGLGGRSILQVARVPQRSGQDKSWVALRQGMGVGFVNENPSWNAVSADGDIHRVRTRLTGWVWVTILAAQWVPC